MLTELLPEPTAATIELCADGALTPKEAVKWSGIPRSELYVHMSRGELAYVQRGKRRLIPRKALARLLASFPLHNAGAAGIEE